MEILGGTISNNLTFEKHINELSEAAVRRCSLKLAFLKTLQNSQKTFVKESLCNTVSTLQLAKLLSRL